MIGEEMKIIYAEGTTAPKQMNQMVKEQWIGIGRNKYNKLQWNNCETIPCRQEEN